MELRKMPFAQYTLSLLREEDDPAVIQKCRALSSPERLKILRMLSTGSMTVTEVARVFYMSVSTAMFHLDILRDAGMIAITSVPGKRGNARICQYRFSALTIKAASAANIQRPIVREMMPVGLYTATGMESVAGFCTAEEQIMFDNGNFFTPRRAQAQLLWASGGWVEYTISNTRREERLRRLTFSLELCSETLSYQLGWKSDITFWLNGVELCTYTSPSDFGGRRGRLNPPWWPDASTQYGELKEITVTEQGCFLDGAPVNSAHTPPVAIFDGAEAFVLRIGNKAGARYKGGFNLFGRGFGDHMQDIAFEAEYEE